MSNDKKPQSRTPIDINQVRIKPDVYIAALLDEANEHLIEVKDLLANKALNGVHPEIPIRSIPYNSVTTFQNATPTKPTDPGGYPAVEDVYTAMAADSPNHIGRPLSSMSLVNDGPGTIYFINKDGYEKFSQEEEVLNVGDIRPLHNVYEIRLRTDIPLTQYRLVENNIYTGSFARAYKANTEIRPTVAANEKIKVFAASFDNATNPLPIVPPVAATYLGPSYHAPLAAGLWQQFTDAETGLLMPFIVPAGYILETFAALFSATTNFTLRAYFELVPGTGVYNLAFTLPFLARSSPTFILNLNPISTQVVDPTGANPTRGILFTITNDDVAATLIGEVNLLMILRRLA